MEEERPWYTATCDYEGVPLYLRYPNGLDYDDLGENYPQLIIVTHVLSEVTNNGLPTGEYNESLLSFDNHLVDVLENSSAGFTVLVETFGGKRTYYMNAKDDFPHSLLESMFEGSYSMHEITVESVSDDNGSFIKKYSKEWGFHA